MEMMTKEIRELRGILKKLDGKKMHVAEVNTRISVYSQIEKRLRLYVKCRLKNLELPAEDFGLNGEET